MSAKSLTREGAWFVGLNADGSLDRKWPYEEDDDGREGFGIVLGDSAKIVKVIPITAAQEVLQAAEERAERLRHSLSGLLIYARGNEHVLGLIHEALAADDAARGGA